MTLVLQPPDVSAVRAQPVRPPAVRPPRRWASAVVLALVAVGATVVVAQDVATPVVRPVAGLLLLFGIPTYLVLATWRWKGTALLEAALCSFVAVLLAIMLGGLALNEGLPLLGVDRPLDRLPVLIATDVGLVALAMLRTRRRGGYHEFRAVRVTHRRSPARLDRWILGASLVLVAAAISGAIRLNNNAGGEVTMVMLCGVTIVLAALIRCRWRLRGTTIALTIYLLALALLFMTSLRGWDVIGHDSALEFYVYQLAHDNGLWQMEMFRSAYNACLSITILPSVVSVLTGVPGAYVFKVLFPLAFAACPVITYLIARRFASTRIAVLAATYFIAFPTFFTDMPFLNRQAIAFLFVGMIFLVATNARWSVRRRRLWVAALSVGVVLSHYSTTYVLIAILVSALTVRVVVALAARLIPRLRRLAPESLREEPRVLGLVNVTVLVVLAVVWTGPLTHTGGQVATTVAQLASALTGGGAGQQSSDVAYSIVGGTEVSREQRMQDFIDDTFEETAVARADGAYFPVELVQRYPTPVLEPAMMPLTPVGDALEVVGVDVAWLNDVMREGAARLLQLFVCIGFLFVLLRRARGLRVSGELFFLAIGAFAAIAAQVVLPALSVDYGVLRAFQQSLLVIAPFLAAGSVHILGPLGARWSSRIASGLALWFVLSLTGVVPQLTGGYGAQLHLNNSGEYYDLYYSHPEEVAAAAWIEDRVRADGEGVIKTQIPGSLLYGFSSEIFVDRIIYPAEVGPHDYVVLGATTVLEDRAVVEHGGDRLAYRYPIAFLDENKDLVFHDGKAVIYR
jgi:uncharacterized membrane protein